MQSPRRWLGQQWRRPGETFGQPSFDVNKMNRPKRLYTVRQVAEIAGVSIRTIRRWIDRGKLPTRQPSGPGGVDLIDLEDLYEKPTPERSP